MTERLRVRPLCVADAQVMAEVLKDPALYVFTGGEPPSAEQLRQRYAVQVRGGPADGGARWINLIVLQDEQPVGYVQATLPVDHGPTEIAWVIGRPWQGRGYAARAAALLLEVLAAQGVSRVVALIHPAHRASRRVAKKLGLEPTPVVVRGEVRWVGWGPRPLGADPPQREGHGHRCRDGAEDARMPRTAPTVKDPPEQSAGGDPVKTTISAARITDARCDEEKEA